MRLDITRSVIGVTLVAVLVAACSGTPDGPATPDPDALRVVATTTVLADLVANVGGVKTDVVSLVPKGGEVHTFDPTPSDLANVAEADLIVMNGLGLDEWLARIVADSGTDARVVELAEDLEGVTLIDGGEHQDEGAASDEHGHEGVNPHLWLDAAYAGRYVDRIIEALSAADPDDAETYRSQGAAYQSTLADLDAEIRSRIGEIPESQRLIVSYHEAFPYFAAAYGLTIVGTIVDAPGQDPSAGEIAGLVEAIRSSGARAVFTEAQFSPELAQTVADEAGVEVVSDLYNDSLGDPPVDTYVGMMRWNADRTVEALQ